MSEIKRRQLLQFSGSAIAAIGLSKLDLQLQGDRYNEVLAQSTDRKLALLVGVNQYPDNISSLQGCLTDVEMQQELLIHRYGFNPNDIETVSDNSEIKPTRAGILETFEEHLIKQAKPGDVVVFHYSGHGSQVIDPDPIPGFEGLNGTMVAYDARSELANETGVGDIMGKTLFLLMHALPTNNITVVLDSCHSGGGARGNYRFRAIPSRLGSKNQAKPSELELTYQEQWLSRLKLSHDKFSELRRKGIAKGVALGSAQASQLATDAPFDGFHAGAFTYQLTRYLWQQPRSRSLGNVFVNLARSTHDLAKSNGLMQEPIPQVQPESNYEKPVYMLESGTPAAEAVVRRVDGKEVKFWLGGIASQSLEAFQEGAIFNLIDSSGEVKGEIAQTSRVGLVGYGTVKDGNPEEGMFLREQVRGVPADLKLRLGLDPSLGTELEAAKSELQSVNRVETIVVNQQLTVDYLLGRMTEEALVQANQTDRVNPPPVGSIGLFTPGLTPVEDSFGRVEESIELAVQRLRPRLKMLLANRILSLLANGNSSSLRVEATVQPVGGRSIVSSFGSRGAETAWQTKTITSTPKQLNAGSEIEIKIDNQEDRDLYLGVLVIGSKGDIVVLHPTDWNAPEEAARVGSKTAMVVPQKTGNLDDDFRFIVRGPSGFFELLVLASTEPLSNALKGLQQIARGRGARSGDPLALDEDEPVNVMDALLGDLNSNSRTGIEAVRGKQAVDAEQLAALSAIIEVVE